MHVAMIRRLHLQPKDGCRFDDPEEMNIDVHNAVEVDPCGNSIHLDDSNQLWI